MDCFFVVTDVRKDQGLAVDFSRGLITISVAFYLKIKILYFLFWNKGKNYEIELFGETKTFPQITSSIIKIIRVLNTQVCRRKIKLTKNNEIADKQLEFSLFLFSRKIKFSLKRSTIFSPLGVFRN